MKRIVILLSLFACFALSAASQDIKYRPVFSVIFDSSNAGKLLRQCSRSIPTYISGFWTPAQRDVDSLESNFKKLYSVSAKGCCVMGGRMFDSLSKFGIQYAGLIIKGKKFIYANAFPFSMISELNRLKSGEPFDPKKDAILVCDGGSYYWGVLYNVEIGEFSELSFNGIG